MNFFHLNRMEINFFHFQGMEFILTTASPDPNPETGVVDKPPYEPPYEKAKLQYVLETFGGKVIDSVGQEKEKSLTYLISDNHSRTTKYIYCIASGIPCVSIEWILSSIEINKLLDWKLYLLKYGYSLEKKRLIEPHLLQPLKGMNICMNGESEELYDIWKPILLAAGAILLPPLKYNSPAELIVAVPASTEIFIMEERPEEYMLNFAEAMSIPVVEPEWMVQTLITGERVAFLPHIYLLD